MGINVARQESGGLKGFQLDLPLIRQEELTKPRYAGVIEIQNPSKTSAIAEESNAKPEWGALSREKRISLIKIHLAKGLKGAEIAAMFSGDVTRNAIAGFIHRYELNGKGGATKRSAGRQMRSNLESLPAHVTKRKKLSNVAARSYPKKAGTADVATETEDQEIQPVPIDPVTGRTVTAVRLLDVTDKQCRTPLFDDPRQVTNDEFYYCGAPALPGKSCCAYCNTKMRTTIKVRFTPSAAAEKRAWLRQSSAKIPSSISF